VDAIQPPFSPIHRDAADDVLPWAREHEAGVIAQTQALNCRNSTVARRSAD
jgi:aryl-alcohol dehydrogenase-like predicted oxidoreductase